MKKYCVFFCVLILFLLGPISAQVVSLGFDFKAGTGFPGASGGAGLTDLHYTNPVLGYTGTVDPRTLYFQGEIPLAVKLLQWNDQVELVAGVALGLDFNYLNLGAYDPNTEKALKVDWVRLGLLTRPEVILLWNTFASEVSRGRVVISLGPYVKGTLINSVSSNTNWLDGNKVVTTVADDWLSWGAHTSVGYQVALERKTWFSATFSWDQEFNVDVPGLAQKDIFGNLSFGMGILRDL